MLEDRIEAVERSLIRLNKTLQELISLYVDTQTNPLLGDLPKNSGYVPTIIKDRDARRNAKHAVSYTLSEVRSIMESAMKVLDTPTIEAHLNNHDATCLADMPEQQFYSFAQTLLVDIESASEN